MLDLGGRTNSGSLSIANIAEIIQESAFGREHHENLIDGIARKLPFPETSKFG